MTLKVQQIESLDHFTVGLQSYRNVNTFPVPDGGVVQIKPCCNSLIIAPEAGFSCASPDCRADIVPSAGPSVHVPNLSAFVVAHPTI